MGCGDVVLYDKALSDGKLVGVQDGRFHDVLLHGDALSDGVDYRQGCLDGRGWTGSDNDYKLHDVEGVLHLLSLTVGVLVHGLHQ